MSVFKNVLVLCVAAGVPCSAQSLKGSDASINRMYRQARAEKLAFYETPRGVRRAVDAGRLRRLVPDSNFTLHQVGYPFVRPATLTFVERLGAQYRRACGEPLRVTSAVRPSTRQPANSVDKSVHPTGMAIDLHKPADGECRAWLRETLLELEDAGVLEATEEFSPPHFHVAVYPTPYRKYIAERARATQAARQAMTRTIAYRIRPGDTLSEIARDHDTTVEAIQRANDLDGTLIQAGDEILIPIGR